jgi:hypothetical protein
MTTLLNERYQYKFIFLISLNIDIPLPEGFEYLALSEKLEETSMKCSSNICKFSLFVNNSSRNRKTN